MLNRPYRDKILTWETLAVDRTVHLLCHHTYIAPAGRDEEAERGLWLAELHLASVASVQALGVLTQEQEMLAAVLRRGDEDVSDAQRDAEGVSIYILRLLNSKTQSALFALLHRARVLPRARVLHRACAQLHGVAADNTAERRRAEREQEETEKARAAMRAKLLDIAGGLSSARDRQQIARDVFKPGHILPTMSVEQAGIIELREVRIPRVHAECSLNRCCLSVATLQLGGRAALRWCVR